MKERTITMPELAMIAGSRAAIGLGIGLLLADRFSNEQRRAVGWTLATIGAVSTIPLVMEVLGRNDNREMPQHSQLGAT